MRIMTSKDNKYEYIGGQKCSATSDYGEVVTGTLTRLLTLCNVLYCTSIVLR